MSEQKICPTCGTEYPLSERFCPRDGTALRSSNAQADLLGSVVADRYHILKKLGEGGMGTVYLAEHVKMGRKSALKVMNPGMNTDADAIARFNREASNASRLSHPNICGIYDFGETPDGLIYLAMEFIEGSSLTSLIEKGGSLPAPRAASIVHQTADALQVAHDAGIVHRDLKPDNIMIAKNRDGTDQVKVVDFGIAKASSSAEQKVTKTGLVVGTPEYMSPEQLAGDKLDGRSDIYSLGLVAFNCLTGGLPFQADTAQEAMIMRLTDRPRTLAEVAPDRSWPDALQATLDKALARDAGERYTSAAQFGREFFEAVSAMPMTQAIEAGTQIVNAAAAKNVPATRVAEGRPSAKTAQMEPPPAASRRPAGAPASAGRTVAVEAPAKKSAMPMVLGGVGGLALAAALFWQFGMKPDASPGTGNSTPATANDTQRVGTGTPPATPGPESTVVAGNGTKTAPAPVTPPRDPAPTPGKSNPGTTTNPVPGTTPTTPSGTSVAAATAAIRKHLDLIESAPEGEEGRIARAAIREVEGFMPDLTGIAKDDGNYLLLAAYRALELETDICKYGKLVLAGRLAADRKGLARDMMAGFNCPP